MQLYFPCKGSTDLGLIGPDAESRRGWQKKSDQCSRKIRGKDQRIVPRKYRLCGWS
jgi:hypothetical protein